MTRNVLVGSILMIGLMGCASVTVRKIPDQGAYDLSTTCDGKPNSPCRNELQRQADGIKGVRYYLPRPYVLVKKEFPIAGGTFFLKGRVDDQLKLLLDGDLPIDLKGVLPDTHIPLDKAKVAFDSTNPALVQKQAAVGKAAGAAAAPANGAAGSGAAATAAPRELLLDSLDLLKDSVPSSSKVAHPDLEIQLTLKVSKDLEAKLDLGADETLNMKEVFLVPLKNGAPDGEGVVPATVVTSTGATATDRVLIAQIAGKKVPAFAALGVEVQFKKDGKAKVVILHRKDFDILNVFATGNGGGSAPTGGDKPKEAPDAPKADEKKASGVKATTSGDPATDPVVYKSDLYDLILLPDFSEQYAIQVKAGIFQASADIGLENGWMMEKFGADIDNSQLGDFILETAGKVIDLGLPKLLGIEAAADMAQEGDDAKTKLENAVSGGKTPQVLVRVDYLEYAVPGIYPIRKPSEKSSCRVVGHENRCPPIADFSTRSRISLAVVDLKAASANGADAPPTTLEEVTNAIKTAIESRLTDEMKDRLFVQGREPLCKASFTLDDERKSVKEATVFFKKDSLKAGQYPFKGADKTTLDTAIKGVLHSLVDVTINYLEDPCPLPQ